MTEFLTATIVVVLAEMGDKTQLLAMAFATRYRWQTVMWGVLAATLVNHLLAVVVGNYITNFIPLFYVKAAAAASFILFGLWTLRGDQLCGEDRKYCYSPFWTVAIAFFWAEMGDKTQLATVALAAGGQSIFAIWMGTTTGMLIADGIGIWIGCVMGKRIPEKAVKWIAALIFIGFGIHGLYEALPGEVWSWPVIAGGAAVIGVLMYAALYWGEHRPACDMPEEETCCLVSKEEEDS